MLPRAPRSLERHRELDGAVDDARPRAHDRCPHDKAHVDPRHKDARDAEEALGDPDADRRHDPVLHARTVVPAAAEDDAGADDVEGEESLVPAAGEDRARVSDVLGNGSLLDVEGGRERRRRDAPTADEAEAGDGERDHEDDGLRGTNECSSARGLAATARSRSV